MVPALPGCFPQGESLDDALANVQEAIRLYLDDLAAEGEPVPADIVPHVTTVEIGRQAARSS
jgi:predicted RNase H-like HicB family nuclease